MTDYGHFSPGQISHAVDEALQKLDLECLDSHTDPTCKGAVELRESLSGTGTRIARCDKHWRERLDLQDEINRRYPATAPADFDPYYAGESWDEDY
jgi:hypothetical protein